MQTSKEKLDVLICKRPAWHSVKNTFLRENQTDKSKYCQASLLKKKKRIAFTHKNMLYMCKNAKFFLSYPSWRPKSETW